MVDHHPDPRAEREATLTRDGHVLRSDTIATDGLIARLLVLPVVVR
jgi:hypothetical protein